MVAGTGLPVVKLTKLHSSVFLCMRKFRTNDAVCFINLWSESNFPHTKAIHYGQPSRFTGLYIHAIIRTNVCRKGRNRRPSKLLHTMKTFTKTMSAESTDSSTYVLNFRSVYVNYPYVLLSGRNASSYITNVRNATNMTRRCLMRLHPRQWRCSL